MPYCNTFYGFKIAQINVVYKHMFWKIASYFNAFPFFRVLSGKVGMFPICALHTQETISGVADSTGQNPFP